MIKKLIQLYWFEKEKKDEEHRTLRKNMARLKKHGWGGMYQRLSKEYKAIDEDYVSKSVLQRRYRTFISKLFFITIFIMSIGYMFFIKSELYESRTSVMVVDMKSTSNADALGLSLLGVGSSSQLQDSMILENYLYSLDLYQIVNHKFDLTMHYMSSALDWVDRLSDDATQEEILEQYRKRLLVKYDEVSGILTIAFAHTDRDQAQTITFFLVEQLENKINALNREKSRKQLAFVEQQHQRTKIKMEASLKQLEKYQEDHNLVDPVSEATASSGVIAELEATLLQKKIAYATMQSYLQEESYELIALAKEIAQIEESIALERKHLVNSSGGLNRVIIAYKKLKMKVEFDSEVYKNALIQLEMTKVDVAKKAKIMSVISHPSLPDGYSYPDKPKMFITIFFVTLLLYGVFSMLYAIVRDHKE